MAQGLILLICAAMLALVSRLVHIQTQMRPSLEAWTRQRLYSEIPIPGRRGSIMDRRERILAGAHDRQTIYADPFLIGDKEVAAQTLSSILNEPEDKILERLENPTSRRYVVLRRGATPEQVKEAKDLRSLGVGVHREAHRDYPMGGLAAHVLGFVGRDGTGLEGIEWSCDRYLRPRHGRRVVHRDARGRALSEVSELYEAPRDGHHVILTIDAAIQEIVERAVAAQVEHHAAESGVGVVTNPRTGEVLAMTCYPGFEPARAGSVPAEHRRNRVLTDPVEPGSTFKPFVMAIALEEGVTHPNEIINCKGGLYLIGRRRLHDHRPYGDLTTEMIMVRSSNIGMAILGQRLGNRRMHEGLVRFGLGRATGIDLPGEGDGLLMPLRNWNSYTTTSVPMGHELALTPIQITTAFSALVNGGRLLEPRVIAAVIDQEGRFIVDGTQVRDRGQALDPAVSDRMRAILTKVVTEGTGRPAHIEKWQLLGKTGTAQVPRTDRRGYEQGAYLASFIAAAPAHDPELVVLVMVRKPTRHGYYGSQVASPAVKQIFEQVLPYLNIPPDPPGVREQPGSLAWEARSIPAGQLGD